MFRIVWIIVYCGLCSELVEAVDEHSLRVKVGETERSHYFCHAFASAPLLDGVEQGGRHFKVVYEVDPSETHALALPFVVCLVVDYSSYSACGLSVFIGDEVLCLAEVERRVLVFAQSGKVITVQVGGIELVAFIQFMVVFNESL